MPEPEGGATTHCFNEAAWPEARNRWLGGRPSYRLKHLGTELVPNGRGQLAGLA